MYCSLEKLSPMSIWNIWKRLSILSYSVSPSAKLRARPQGNGTYITWSVMQPASCRFIEKYRRTVFHFLNNGKWNRPQFEKVLKRQVIDKIDRESRKSRELSSVPWMIQLLRIQSLRHRPCIPLKLRITTNHIWRSVGITVIRQLVWYYPETFFLWIMRLFCMTRHAQRLRLSKASSRSCPGRHTLRIPYAIVGTYRTSWWTLLFKRDLRRLVHCAPIALSSPTKPDSRQNNLPLVSTRMIQCQPHDSW